MSLNSESRHGPPQLVRGQLQQNPKGRAYVSWDEAHDDWVVLPAQRGGALDGDTVEVEPAGERGGRQLARVVRVVQRGRSRLTGMYVPGRPPRLEPDDPRIVCAVDLQGPVPGGVGPGDAVLAEIVSYPDHPDGVIGARLQRRLGEPGLLVTEVAKSVAGAGLEESFSAAAEEAAARTAETLPAQEASNDRLDLRQLHFVTIDPQTARDFDDAVALEPGPEGTTRVWVAVADVSHYVHEGSVLDRAARQRGCSIYLPDRAIPMLPEALSSGICSLVPDQDRLAMAVRMDVTDDGQLLRPRAAAAVIHSHGRLDYAGVAAALQGKFAGRRESYREHAAILEGLQRVTAALRRRRLGRGSLDLDLDEAQVRLDEDDPNRVRWIGRSRPDEPIKRAYSLIEELMVAANEVVGQLFVHHRAPTVWRVHAPPRPEAMELLRQWVASYGLLLRQGPDASAALTHLLGQLKGHRAARPLSFLVLRTLKQAIYSVNNLGHFGLGSPAYLHFTSPIRRYPDLQVHRLLKLLLRQSGQPAGSPVKTVTRSEEALAQLASHCSTLERQAIEVERDVQRVYAASLMRDRIGDEHWGTVTGVSSFGLFVSLDDPFVEGLVRLPDLPRGLHYDAEQLRLVGRGSAAYSLGDRMRVRVADTSVRRRQVDFAPTDGDTDHQPDPDYIPRPASERPARGERRHRQRPGDRRHGPRERQSRGGRGRDRRARSGRRRKR